MESTNNYMETDLGNVSPNPKGTYDNATAYEYLDLVEYQGGSYLCTVDIDKKVKGISPTVGQNSETWQLVALPGTSTEEYVAKHTEVIEKAKQVETSRAAVELCKQEVESAQADVEQMRQDTQQAAQNASDANTKAQQAEASRSAAQTSEQNAAASRDLANTYKEAAETAKSAAETAAQNASESKTAAETAAQNATQSKADIDSIKAGIEEAAKGENVSQIQQNMNDISQLKESKISKPSIDGTNGQVLSINEDGLLVWIDASGGTLDYRNVRNDESFTMDGTVNPSDGQYPQKGLEYEYTNLKNATTITNGRLLFNSSNDFTVFIAIKKEAAANIIDTGSTAKAFSFFINWDKNIYAQIRLTDNSAYPSMVYTPDNTSEMKYLAVTKNGDAYTLYYNGNSVRTMNSGGKQNIYSDDLVINQSEALINKMLIYNRCLTATEIKTTFSNIKKEVGE